MQLNLQEEGTQADGPISDKTILERPNKILWCGNDCVVI